MSISLRNRFAHSNGGTQDVTRKQNEELVCFLN